MENEMFHDYAVIPALYGDFGHYLLLDPEYLFVQKSLHDWRRRINENESNLISYVDVVDKQIGMYSMVESLVKENNKFRAILNPNRIGQHCHDKEILVEFEEFCARFILRTFKKYNLENKVYTDYLWLGTNKCGIGTEKQRKDDLEMIKKMKSVIYGKDFLQPNSRYISINSKAEYKSEIFFLDSQKTKQKQTWAEKVKDVSLVWQVGMKRRKALRNANVFSYEDTNFLDKLQNQVGRSYYNIIEKMIQLQISDQLFEFPPREDLLVNFPIFFSEPFEKFLFVDFETDFQKCIYMFGYSSLNEGYRNEWADDLCPEAERELMDTIHRIITTHKQNGGIVVYFYAEDLFWRERCKFHNIPDYQNLFSGSIDLHKIFVKGPLIIKGVLNFKLKSIAKGLFNLGCIPISQPEGCADGAESVNIAKKWFSSHKQEFQDVLDAYNQYDCDVLLEITRFLREFDY